MKSLTALFLILITLFTTQAFAEDATPQPLTRADCETTPGWSWSETANICEGGAKDVAALKPQPLTRSDCEQAGMSWNDTALVCDGASARKATADINANPVGSSILLLSATVNCAVRVRGTLILASTPRSNAKKESQSPGRAKSRSEASSR